MTVVHTIEVEDRLREQGWQYFEMEKVGPRWQHIRYPFEGFSLTDALYLEWQDALQRAGRAEHVIGRLKSQLAILCLSLLVIVATFATTVAYMK